MERHPAPPPQGVGGPLMDKDPYEGWGYLVYRGQDGKPLRFDYDGVLRKITVDRFKSVIC